jgi:hypothetical protein
MLYKGYKYETMVQRMSCIVFVTRRQIILYLMVGAVNTSSGAKIVVFLASNILVAAYIVGYQ